LLSGGRSCAERGTDCVDFIDQAAVSRREKGRSGARQKGKQSRYPKDRTDKRGRREAGPGGFVDVPPGFSEDRVNAGKIGSSGTPRIVGIIAS